MIDGIYPSQFAQINAMRSSHHRNLSSISKANKGSISYLASGYMKMTQNKKMNHVGISLYLGQLEEFYIQLYCVCYIEQNRERIKRNISMYDKLKKISVDCSKYRSRSGSIDPLLHHNSFYLHQKRFDEIERSNSLIASRITKSKGQINVKKQQNQYKVKQLNVSRLQKFQRFKRLTRVVSKCMKNKFRETAKVSYFSKVQVNPQSPKLSMSSSPKSQLFK